MDAVGLEERVGIRRIGHALEQEGHQRRALLRRVHATTAAVAEEWADVASTSKGLTPGHPLRGEEWLSGPYAALVAIDAYADTLAVEETAVIVVDMQNAYASAGGYLDLAGFDVLLTLRRQGKGQALSIGLTSYDGGVYFGLNADRAAMPDLDVLGQCLTDALRIEKGTRSSERFSIRGGLTPTERANTKKATA